MTNLKFNNIFDAVTDDKVLALELQTCADLMSVLKSIVKTKGWEHKVAAKNFGLTQPGLNNLIKGRVDKFRIDKLITAMLRVGYRFKI